MYKAVEIFGDKSVSLYDETDNTVENFTAAEYRGLCRLGFKLPVYDSLALSVQGFKLREAAEVGQVIIEVIYDEDTDSETNTVLTAGPGSEMAYSSLLRFVCRSCGKVKFVYTVNFENISRRRVPGEIGLTDTVGGIDLWERLYAMYEKNSAVKL